MESSKSSEEIFDSVNLNPSLFINASLNLVDDLVDGAFDHFHQDAAANLLRTHQDPNRSDHLQKGVAKLKIMVQAVLDKQLSVWERYCLAHCFSLPEGFSLPNDSVSAGDSSTDIKVQQDRELDEQLHSLRNEIDSVVKEKAEHTKQLREQKRKSDLNGGLATSVAEASQLYEQQSNMLEDLTKAAEELREQVKQQTAKRLKQAEHGRIERLNGPTGVAANYDNGLSNVTAEELKMFIAAINNF